MTPHRAFRRVHVCMKDPCSYCAARANAQHPPDTVGGYAEMIAAVANELRRRTVRTAADRQKPRKKRR
jgi:hypothetical protein